MTEPLDYTASELLAVMSGRILVDGQTAFAGVGIPLLAAVLARPGIHLLDTAFWDVNTLEDLPSGYVNDASRLNRTEVAEVWQVPVDRDDPEEQIALLLARARAEQPSTSER